MDITITAPQGAGKTSTAEDILKGRLEYGTYDQVMRFNSLCDDYGNPLSVDDIVGRLVKFNPPAVIFDECMTSMYNFVAAVTAVKKFRAMRPKRRIPYTTGGADMSTPFIAIYCRQGGRRSMRNAAVLVEHTSGRIGKIYRAEKKVEGKHVLHVLAESREVWQRFLKDPKSKLEACNEKLLVTLDNVTTIGYCD